jgi:VIT1/CCC1 family predicted Fe2+/Mn2+ transporter
VGKIYRSNSQRSGTTLFINKIITVLLGYTFILKKLKKTEQLATKDYNLIKNEIPEAEKMAEDENRHEHELINMLDEERLQYIGSMVLGLNDALVELTGAIAGVTFALAHTKLVALTGIVTEYRQHYQWRRQTIWQNMLTAIKMH